MMDSVLAQAVGGAANLPWGQFGLAGAVIGALFLVLFHFMKSHREERTEILSTHRSERTEWREDALRRQDEARDREESFRQIFTSLEDTIKANRS